MVKRIPPTEDAIILKFGGGIHSRASEDEINERECFDGQNFDLDLQNLEFRNRKPFDLLSTAPNAAEIRGFAGLLSADGSISMLVQSGDTVYEWNGVSFTSVGAVNASARLRGRLEQNFTLSDKVIITDMNLTQPVMEWDGSTLSTMSHNLTGDFLAKYCFVDKERAFYGNVVSNTIATPHMLVGSGIEDHTDLSVSNKPSSALAESDPFFMLTPDLRPINGLVSAFQTIVMSSNFGSLFIISGASAKDFAIDELYPRSATSGDESMAYIGNDVAYGRQGRLETVSSTDRFADVETDDLTVDISDKIEGFKNWNTIYNSRLQRVYFIPENQQQVWVLHKPLVDTEISPWSKWSTLHPSSFNVTAAMNLLDPVDGLEYVFFGDSIGNLYRLEGSGTGDAGTSIRSERLSKLFSAPLDADIYQIEGWIKYRKGIAATVTLNFEFAGEHIFNQPIIIDIPAATGKPFYGTAFYYGTKNFYRSAFTARLARRKFTAAGQSNEFQIRVSIEGAEEVRINEIGLRFLEAS